MLMITKTMAEKDNFILLVMSNKSVLKRKELRPYERVHNEKKTVQIRISNTSSVVKMVLMRLRSQRKKIYAHRRM